ncbi:hypothetical protein PV325_003376 [Microctonus aethiopoides]|nr:hypothetical protein PV325_003376 [Microctonus aethiopoides]
MSNDISENEMKTFAKDTRIACRYGTKCYQKNPVHQEKYKHPPVQKNSPKKTTEAKGMKRKIDDCQDSDKSEEESDGLESKYKEADVSCPVTDTYCISPSSSSSSESKNDNDSDSLFHDKIKNGNKKCRYDDKPDELIDHASDVEIDHHTKETIDNSSPSASSSLNVHNKAGESSTFSNNVDSKKEIIKKLFLFDMPDDFYQFYNFCTSLSPNDPSMALKIIDLKLVGPFDVLNGTITKLSDADDDNEKYLRHWRYFYDPPEFQTVLKGKDGEDLHYGYWRDECNDKPIFVAKNSANVNCKIIAVASNIFGAVKFHIHERMKSANVFEKSRIARILKMLTTYARDHKIDTEKKSNEMRARERNVVTNTFHGAGIVVPYDKKTQVGYRPLAATDSNFQKILGKIDKAESEEVKTKHMREIEEMVRMATIAADECDFGTSLELGHDLFATGNESFHKTILNMFSMAYSLLHRPQFLKIAIAHLKNRKKGSNLSQI